MYRLSYILFFWLFFFSCTQKREKELEVLIPASLQMIGHKGSGNSNQYGNINLEENSWEALFNSIQRIDGSEMDVQMSADSTFWIFHDFSILNCEDSLVPFVTATDKDIIAFSKCNYKAKLIQLETFFSKAKEQPWENKTIVLDLKFLWNENIPADSNLERKKFYDFVSKEIIHFQKNVNFKVGIEVFSESQYRYFDSVFPEKTFLVNHYPTVEFAQEIQMKKWRTSFSIYEIDERFHNMSFDNLWTINTVNDFLKCLDFQPQIIQSDNIPLMEFFKTVQAGGKIKLFKEESHLIQAEDKEFFLLEKIQIPLTQNELIGFQTLTHPFPKEVYLTVTAFNDQNEGVDWLGFRLNDFQHAYHFIDTDFLHHLGATEVKLSIWNKDLKPLDHKISISRYRLEAL